MNQLCDHRGTDVVVGITPKRFGRFYLHFVPNGPPDICDVVVPKYLLDHGIVEIVIATGSIALNDADEHAAGGQGERAECEGTDEFGRTLRRHCILVRLLSSDRTDDLRRE